MAPSEPDDFMQRIRAVLSELKPLDQYEGLYARLITGITDPPSYIAEIVLGGIGGLPIWKQEEKSRWQVQLTFRGFKFQVRDWKGMTLSIDTESGSAERERLAELLLEKIRFAGRILDKALEKDAKSVAASGDFYLVNTYNKVRRLYEQFRDDTLETIATLEAHHHAGIPPHEVEHPPGVDVVVDQVITDFLNRGAELNRKIAGYCCAAIAFYFSHLEVLMDVLYPFLERSPTDFAAFRGKALDERFKETFPVSGDKKIKQIYEALLDLWRKTRNVVLHGYGGEEGILIPFGRFGLIPISINPC